MADRQLSPNFTLSEFLVSQTAARSGIANVPTPQEVDNLEQLCQQVLEQVRTLLGNKPIFISSGYRSPALNTAVGGAQGSDHVFGRAADFTCPGFGSVRDVWTRLRGAPDLPFHQLIREFDHDDHGWVHISWRRPAERRHQVLIIDRNGTQVLPA
jgi:zinc D-Ala-D-Ala carboxypeptidase